MRIRAYQTTKDVTCKDEWISSARVSTLGMCSCRIIRRIIRSNVVVGLINYK